MSKGRDAEGVGHGLNEKLSRHMFEETEENHEHIGLGAEIRERAFRVMEPLGQNS
jgi:hypothetical protein